VARDTSRTGTRTETDLDSAVDETVATVPAAGRAEARDTLNQAVDMDDPFRLDAAATGMIRETEFRQEGPAPTTDVDDPTPDRDLLYRETAQLDDVKAEGEGAHDRSAPARAVDLGLLDREAAAGPDPTLPILLGPAHVRVRCRDRDHHTREDLGVDPAREASAARAIREAPSREQSRQDEVRVHADRRPYDATKLANHVSSSSMLLHPYSKSSRSTDTESRWTHRQYPDATIYQLSQLDAAGYPQKGRALQIIAFVDHRDYLYGDPTSRTLSL
jgi:hypothetical protein